MELSRQMQNCVNSAHWVELCELEVSRRDLLTSYFSVAISPDETRQLEQDIPLLQEYDQQVLAVTRAARDALAEKMNNMGHGRRAQQAYTRNLG
jgi:phenylacetate-coenzyme A ligase PaaK-like adenylate-forming protein